VKITRATPLVLATAWRDLIFLKVETDEGLVGVGEARSMNRLDATLGYLAGVLPRYVLGSDPFEIEKLVHRMSHEVEGGSFALPPGPGLGVKLDEDVIRAHPPRNVHFDLFAEDWHKRRPQG